MIRSRLMDFGQLLIKPWIFIEESANSRVASDFINPQGPRSKGYISKGISPVTKFER